MKGFNVSPRLELLLAAVLTTAATQHVAIYLGLLLLAAMVFPSAKMGKNESFVGLLPMQIWLLRLLAPFIILLSTLEFFGIGENLVIACRNGSLCGLSSYPIKGIVFWFYVSSSFVFVFLRANIVFKYRSYFHTFMALILLLGIPVSYFGLSQVGSSYGEILMYTSVSLFFGYFAFSCLASFVGFVFSIGRRT